MNQTVTKDENIIASAWLHDILEDAPATREDIEVQVNTETLALVDWLTDPFEGHVLSFSLNA